MAGLPGARLATSHGAAHNPAYGRSSALLTNATRVPSAPAMRLTHTQRGMVDGELAALGLHTPLRWMGAPGLNSPHRWMGSAPTTHHGLGQPTGHSQNWSTVTHDGQFCS